MATLNKNYKTLQGSYLFSEIAKRTKEFKENNPGAFLFNLGIGNTTQPLTPSIINGLLTAVEKLGSAHTYTRYGDEQGDIVLRKTLVLYYKSYGVNLFEDEIFISDGAKSDLGNILSIFDNKNRIAVQDPVYPAYIDSSVIYGYAQNFLNGKYKGIVYMPCTKENGFFPSIPEEKVDIIYICSPNNPTGAVATKKQLKAFVDYANKNNSVIIFDSAYSAYIQDKALPKSIYEIPGAKTCAIEINSFSKSTGFTGVRLGWTVVPKELIVEGSIPGEIQSAWNRRQTTIFNGASNISQAGGISALTMKGQIECKEIISYYLQNAALIKKCLTSLGISAWGGDNAPYIWVKTPGSMSSWEFFDKLLQETHVVSTPGVGFGLQGEGYIRLSAFGNRSETLQAANNIKKFLKL